jgi:hypothetical protein
VHKLSNKSVYSFEIVTPTKSYVFRGLSSPVESWVDIIQQTIAKFVNIIPDPVVREILIEVRVAADGPTRVLTFEEENKTLNVRRCAYITYLLKMYISMSLINLFALIGPTYFPEPRLVPVKVIIWIKVLILQT